MEILQHIWGATPEGEAIVIYTLRNDNEEDLIFFAVVPKQ